MHTEIPAADSADFLALVPMLAGFRPRESIVLVLFHGSRSLGLMRVDLPAGDAELDRNAATLVGLVCKVGEADGFAAVVYTDAPHDGGTHAMPHADLIDAIAVRADACGLQIRDALCVARDAWGSYLERDSPARPLSEIDARAAAQKFPALPVDPDQSSGASLPQRSAASKREVERAIAGLSRALSVLSGAPATRDRAGDVDLSAPPPDPFAGVDPRALAAAAALDDVPEFFEDVLDWGAEPDAHSAAALIWCFDVPALRDIAVAQWCHDIGTGDDALAAQRQWEAGADYPSHLAAHLWGEGARPNAARLIAGLRAVRAAAAVSPRALQPGLLAAAAWLSWALGRSTHAHSYAQRALAIDPSHGLSQIMCTMVDAGWLPEWAFESEPTSGMPTSRAERESSRESPGR